MMENDETSSAKTDSNASTSSSAAASRKPCCARCRNHRVKVALKGHKRICPYKSCKCPKCEITADRQKITAMQIALRRALLEDETKVIAQGEVEPAPFIVKGSRIVSSRSGVCHEGNGYDSYNESPISEHGSNGACSAISGVVGVPTSSRLPPLHPQTGATADLPSAPAGDNVEIMLQYSMKLLELFQYSLKMLPLMYLIVKDSGANLEEAVRRIVEANNEIRTMHFWKAMRSTHDRPYYGASYTASMGTADAPTYDG